MAIEKDKSGAAPPKRLPTHLSQTRNQQNEPISPDATAGGFCELSCSGSHAERGPVLSEDEGSKHAPRPKSI